VSLSQQSGSVAQATPLRVPNLSAWRYLWLYNTGPQSLEAWWTGPSNGTPDFTLSSGQWQLVDAGAVSPWTLSLEGFGRWVTDVEPIASQVGAVGPIAVGSGQLGLGLEPSGLQPDKEGWIPLGTPQPLIYTSPNLSLQWTLPAGYSDVEVVAVNANPAAEVSVWAGYGAVGVPLDGFIVPASSGSGIGSGRGTLSLPQMPISGAVLDVVANWVGTPTPNAANACWLYCFVRPHDYLTASFQAPLANNTTSPLVAGVAGQRITVWALDISVGPYTGAGAGFYGGLLEDASAAVIAARTGLTLFTAVGAPVATVAKTFPKGLRLPAGEALVAEGIATGGAQTAIAASAQYTVCS